MDGGHLRTILWLRWRLSRNQWSRGGSVNAVLTFLLMGIGLAISFAGGVAGLLAGIFLLDSVAPPIMLLVWDGIVLAFLFLWTIGLVSDIQRSESIDISRMLHLPVSLRGIFVINYLASHVTPSIVLFLPAMLGLSLGLVISRGGAMLVMPPLVLGFVFMITAWTYCLRGWLVTLMMNPRRRRAVIAGVTFTFVVISQLPNFLGNVVFDHKHHRSPTAQAAPAGEPNAPGSGARERVVIGEAVLIAHEVVPILWVGNGAMSSATGSLRPAILGTLGMFGLGALGLRRAYRSTVRFYQGYAKVKRSERKAAPVAPTVAGSRTTFLERRLPGLADETAAMVLASLRSLSRASEVKLMLATNFLMILFFGTMILLRRSDNISEDMKPFFTAGTVVFTFFGLAQLMFNLFGFDREGFRALVLMPVPRRHILLGKNLAFLPISVGIGGVLFVLVKVVLHVSLMIILAGVFQLLSAFFLLSMLGNLVSTLVPHRIAPGSMKPTKTSMVTTLLIIVSRLLFPVAMLPILLAPGLGLLCSRVGWFPAASTNLVASFITAVLLILLYGLTLDGLGDLLQRREQRVLQVVTQEIE